MTLRYAHYSVEEIPALEAELGMLTARLEKQRTLVADLPAEDKAKVHLEASTLLELERSVEKLREKLQQTKNVAFNRNLIGKFNDIIDKNDCLRVRFYDWLATKLEHLVVRIRNHAMKINKPCVVKIPASKASDSEPDSGKYKTTLRKDLTVMAKEHAKKEAEYKQFLIEKLKQGK